jgi:hypothetical protein
VLYAAIAGLVAAVFDAVTGKDDAEIGGIVGLTWPVAVPVLVLVAVGMFVYQKVKP